MVWMKIFYIASETLSLVETMNRKVIVSVIAAVAIAIVAFAIWLFSTQGGLGAGAFVPTATRGRRAVLSIGVEGVGAVAVNGSEALGTVTLPAGSSIAVEAKPADGWRLKSMLVNGTPVSPPLTLIVRGNTTIRAVFERAPVEVRVEVVGPGRVMVNDSLVESNSTLEVAPGSLVLVELRPAQCYSASLLVNGSPVDLVNGTAVVRVSGGTSLRAAFGPAVVTLEVDTKGLPALVRGEGWEKLVNGTARLTLKACEKVNVTTWKVFSYANYNITVSFIHQWRYEEGGNTTYIPLFAPLKPINITISPSRDARLEGLVASYPVSRSRVVRGEITYNNRTVETVMTEYNYTSRWLNYKYLGDGWWQVEASWIGTVYIKMPEGWSKAKVYLCVERVGYGGGIDVGVIINNDDSKNPPFLAYSVTPFLEESWKAVGNEMLPVGRCYPVTLSRNGEVLEADGIWSSRLTKTRYFADPVAGEGWLCFTAGVGTFKVKVEAYGRG